MRKLMMAVMAVAGLGVLAGCEDTVRGERQDLAEERQDLAETRQEVREETRAEIAEERQEAREEVADARGEVVEERRELAEELRERPEGVVEVEGLVQRAEPNAIVLVVPEQNNRQMRFEANQQTQVMRDGQQMSLRDLNEGDEIRASYMVTENGNLVLSNIEVEKQGPQMPQQQQY